MLRMFSEEISEIIELPSLLAATKPSLSTATAFRTFSASRSSA
jgi:hypothetical protein